MKYLGLHKMLWLIIVVVLTLIESVILYVFWVLILIWSLKVPDDYWKETHTSEDYDAWWSGEAFSDRNIVETIKRRYRVFFN